MYEKLTRIKCPHCGAPLDKDSKTWKYRGKYYDLPSLYCHECGNEYLEKNERAIKIVNSTIEYVELIDTNNCEVVSSKDFDTYQKRKLNEFEDYEYKKWLEKNKDNMLFITRYLRENKLID